MAVSPAHALRLLTTNSGCVRATAEIVGILLAAGAGRRFGSDKLLHRLADGRPITVVAASRLLPACDRVARDLLAAETALIVRLVPGDPAILRDIDTPADLRRPSRSTE